MAGLKICHIVGHGDQRAIKECLALKFAGHEVLLLTRAVNAYANAFDRVVFFDDDPSLIRAIKSTSADIYHIHCKPESIPRLSIQTLMEVGRPWVYDVHDLDLTRFEHTTSGELYSLLNSPYLIYPDAGIEERANQLFFNHFPAELRPKSLSLLPYYSMVDLVYPMIQPNPAASRERIRKIVYEGNIIVPAIENIKNFPYYDLRFTSHVLSQWGYEMHIYPVGIDFNQARQFYDTSDAVMHVPIDYPSLVQEMGRYGWGFFGAFTKSAQASNTFANKIFDYICAGIPCVVMNADRMGQFLEETGFGVVIRSFEDIVQLKENVTRWEDMQQRILTERGKYSMEANIGQLVAFYEQALADSCWVKSRDKDISSAIVDAENLGNILSSQQHSGEDG